ncbi:porin [Enterovibrio sp. Hal110]
MDKTFKRSLLGMAVAVAAMSGTANAAIELNGEAVQFYGQAAGNYHIDSNADGDTSAGAEIESRIGFRGVVEFADFGPDLVWQIEGGNADRGGFDPETPWTHNNNGQLGARDTYLGLAFDGVGSLKFGRQLVAAYNYVDWPHTNPGLGDVIDWNLTANGATIGDRVDDNLRFDSESFGGFSFQASLSGMTSSTDDKVISIAGNYQLGSTNIHGGYYTQPEADVSYYIVGANGGIGKFSYSAGYRAVDNDGQTQDAFSVTGQYMLTEKALVKVGYASSSDTDNAIDKDGVAATVEDGDEAINVRFGYLLPSTYLYIDSRNYKHNGSDDFHNRILIGAEYYF